MMQKKIIVTASKRKWFLILILPVSSVHLISSYLLSLGMSYETEKINPNPLVLKLMGEVFNVLNPFFSILYKIVPSSNYLSLEPAILSSITSSVAILLIFFSLKRLYEKMKEEGNNGQFFITFFLLSLSATSFCYAQQSYKPAPLEVIKNTKEIVKTNDINIPIYDELDAIRYAKVIPELKKYIKEFESAEGSCKFQAVFNKETNIWVVFVSPGPIDLWFEVEFPPDCSHTSILPGMGG